jgi:hypothetical protein
MSRVRVAFRIARLDEQVCSKFRPFSRPLGSTISFLRTMPHGTGPATLELRSGLPAPLNRLDRSRRPAPLPGPAAHPLFTRGPGSREAALAGLRRWVGNRQRERLSISLASDKRHIRFSQRYRGFPEVPRSSPTADLPDWRTRHAASRTGHGIETGAKRPKLEQVR